MTPKSLFIILVVLAALAMGYAAYDVRQTTRSEAGREIKEAAESSADFIKDTGSQIKQEAREL